MSYKVVRDANNDLVCYGPNTEQYAPGIPAGSTLFIESAVPTDSAAVALAKARVTGSAAIDSQAGTTRKKYITDVAGQAETYMAKATDAASYKAASYLVASIATYLLVQAEGKALYGVTPTAAQYQAAADGILTQQAQWMGLAGAIEQQRRAGKIAVSGALTADAALAAQQAAITALAAL